MNRTRFLLTSLLMASAIPLGAACNAKVVSLGRTDTLASKDIATVTGTPTACAAGWAHPNVCCTAGPNEAASCGAWEENPFRACDQGSTTYPDPLSCCSLADPSQCEDTGGANQSDADVDGGVSTPPSYGCGYACPPGWWSNGTGPGCCTQAPGGSIECEAPAYPEPVDAGTVIGVGGSTGSNSGGTTNSGGSGGTPGYDPDAGVLGSPTDGGVITTPAPGPDPLGPTNPPAPGNPPVYDGGSGSLCGACPTDWSQNPDQPELCCQTFPDGTTACFSQATGPIGVGGGGYPDGGVIVSPPGMPVDAGVPVPDDAPSGAGWATASAPGSNAPECNGSDSLCQCTQTVNGHSYALYCGVGDSGAIECSCFVDQTISGGTSIGTCGAPTDIEAAFTATSGCGFP